MALNIFSFNWEALFDFIANAPADDAPLAPPVSDAISELSETISLTTEHSAQTEAVMNAILESATLAVSAASAKSDAEKITSEKTTAETPAQADSAIQILPLPVPVDEENRKEMLELIRMLQNQLTYSYQSTDMIFEKVSLNNLRAHSEANKIEDSDPNRQEIKRSKAEELQIELKKKLQKQNKPV